MYFDVQPVSALYLCIPFFLLLFYWLKHNQSFAVLATTLIIKIVYSFALLYFVINRWDFGDLPTYYTLAHNLVSADYVFLTGSLATAQLHSVIFSIFGTSLYGLALISACIAHFSFFLMGQCIFDERETPAKHNALLLINILPILSMQSTYIGREPWLLLGTSFLFYFLNDKVFNKILVIFIIFAIAMTRPYQGMIILFCFGLTLLIFYGVFNLKIFLLIILTLPFNFYILSKVALYLDSLTNLGPAAFLSESYGGGNQIFTPYPFPFTPLQLFRPFPWDSLEIFMLVASVENSLVCIFLIKLILHLIKKKKSLRSYGIPVLFSLIFVTVYGGLFMFSENVGDLSRRHVYYFPLIIFVYLKVYGPILKARLGSRRFL
jgi:hypothetical protein